jgi:hypothetical protein
VENVGVDRGSEILVSVEHADGIAAVVRRQDGVWLAGYLEAGGATGLADYVPVVEGLSGDRTVQGGLLPPGAVGAEVVDRVGDRRRATAANGAWVVVLDQPVTGELSPVRFVDRDGETVPRPVPDDWARAPVVDLFEPCPACGAIGWDELRPLGDARGRRSTPGGGWEPAPIVVCRTCGHEELEGGALVSLAGDGEAPAGPATDSAISQAQEEWRRADRAGLERVGFPVYAVAGRVPELGGHGSSAHDVVQSVTVVHRDPPPGGLVRLSVETTVVDQLFEGEAEIARNALVNALHDRVPENGEPGRGPPRSEAGAAVWLVALHRERTRLAALAEVREQTLRVDRQEEAFCVAELGSSWSAVHRRGDLLIIVTGRDAPIGEVALESLDNVADALAGET